ncbi:MAG: uroporphyrinogen decarboxylase family protein [bacterium]|nr:uroporphyrinogen decarboxylase family protein [bacterium]
MTARERFIETLLFGSPDKIPFEPGKPREKTLARWHQEGLPENRDWFEFLCETICIAAPPPSYPPFEGLVNFRMIPTFEEKVLEHRDGHYIVQDWMGNIVEISDEYDYTYIRHPKDFVTRKWHKFPVTNRQEFEEMKRRYDPDEPSRYPKDFREMIKKLKERDYIITLQFSGPFWQLREWCGFEPLCMLFVEDPDFVREMIEFWTGFVSKTMTRALDAGIVDRIYSNEDMAYKAKSMISPEMTGEFLLPAWKRWATEARQSGVPLIDEDSDGFIGELIPIWIEAGFNVCDPIEVAAGNDIVEYRQKFGNKIAFRQGVDKRCIAKGGKAIEDELTRLVPVIKSGGFIPGCDHGVPFDISWQNFVYYSRLLAELTGWL